MAKSKEQKKKEIENLCTKLTQAKSVVFSSFDNVPVKEVETLRKELLENNAEMVVIKKTLMKKALDNSKIKDVNMDEFKGSISAVIGYKDEVAPAKLVSKFKDEHETVNIFSGMLDNKVISLDVVEELAKLLSREELIAKVVGSIKAPVANLVGVTAGVLRGLVGTLQAVADSKK